MEPLTNKTTDRELIEKCESILSLEPEYGELYYEPLSKLLTRFKSLTENRSELVEKCVEAIYKAISKNGTINNSGRIELWGIYKNDLYTALTQVLNPENTRHESAKTGVEDYRDMVEKILVPNGYKTVHIGNPLEVSASQFLYKSQVEHLISELNRTH